MSRILTFFAAFAVFVCAVEGSALQAAEQAVLYHHPSCSHCKDVKDYLDSVNKRLPMKSTQNASYRKELASRGGKGVPALYVNGRLISGSKSIISYLKKNPDVMQND